MIKTKPFVFAENDGNIGLMQIIKIAKVCQDGNLGDLSHIGYSKKAMRKNISIPICGKHYIWYPGLIFMKVSSGHVGYGNHLNLS